MPLNRSPSDHLVGYLTEALARHEPFVRMEPRQVRQLVLAARECYAPAGTPLQQPEDGVPRDLCWIRQGSVIGRPVAAPHQAFELEAGSLWPVAALQAGRPVQTRYAAHHDCFYLRLPWTQVLTVMAESPVLAQHLRQLHHSMLQASVRLWRQQLQDRQPPRPDLEQALSNLPHRQVLSLPQSVSLHQALTAMSQRQVGSVLFTDDRGQLSGILTRHDLLDRVVLAGHALHEPASSVMSSPVRAAEAGQTLADAASSMVQHGLRHLPVVHQGKVVNLVSERDLFAMQQQTLQTVGSQIDAAGHRAQFRQAARAIRDLAGHLLAQGVQAQTLTRLISDLNDRFTRRIIALELRKSHLSDQEMCWLALGSEGRQEQTVATDQDNALIYVSAQPEQDRTRWQTFAQAVNVLLDECGYPLCRGGIMASKPAWCRSLAEWHALSAQWIEQGAPQDLLNAAVLLDMRALSGQSHWVEPWRRDILAQIARTPRFLRQWVDKHLQTGVALNWHGGLAIQTVDDQDVIDIKHSGTAIVVDAARILALSCGLEVTSTPERLRQAGQHLGIAEAEYAGWVSAFFYLQSLRLRQQVLPTEGHADPNKIAVASLNLLDRQMLKTVFHAIRGLQQRLQLDWLR